MPFDTKSTLALLLVTCLSPSPPAFPSSVSDPATLRLFVSNALFVPGHLH